MIPPDAELTERPEEIPAWDDMPDDLKPVLARQMEVYAGFLEHTDHHVGRLVDALAELEILDDTLVYYVIGDNGASAEGTPNGCFNELVVLNGAFGLETTEFMVSKIDDFGTPGRVQPLRRRLGARDGHAVPVDEAGRLALGRHAERHDRPLAGRHPGAGRGPLAVPPRDRRRADHPRGRRPAGAAERERRPAAPLEGVSMAYSFDDADADDRHTTQYFEMFCNRGIYHEGWTAVTRHSIPWVVTEMPAFDDDVWELYGPDDWTQAHDLARRAAREARRAPAPLPSSRRRSTTCCRSTTAASSASTPTSPVARSSSRARRSSSSAAWAASARTRRHDQEQVARDHGAGRRARGGANGVIVSQGGAFGGFVLYAKDGKPAYCYNLFGLQQFKVYGDEPIPAASTRCGWSSPTTAAGSARAATVTLYVDGEQVGEGRVDGTVPMLFSADETTDVGSDTATPVSDDYGPKDSEFTGTVRWVQIDIDAAAEDVDHLIGPEERLRVAMARQ